MASTSISSRTIICQRCSHECSRTGQFQKHCVDCRQALRLENAARNGARYATDENRYDPTGFKVCSTCGIGKRAEHFHRTASGKFGVSAKCKACACEKSRSWHKNNSARAKVASRNWRIKNAVENKKKKSAYAANNRALINARKKQWTKDKPHLRKASHRRRYLKEISLPEGKLNLVMACAVKRCLGGIKARQRTKDILGFSSAELRVHLERQFLKGMTWVNYGKHGWHIDHVVPLASFRFETPDDPEFKAAWALTNLRPLWAEDNLKKNAKRTHLI